LLRTFKYLLRPTAEHRATFDRWLDQCCELYNAGLEQRVMWYRMAGKSLALFDQNRQLTELRDAESEYARTPLKVERSALRRLDRTFQAFFRRVKEKPNKIGFPRFRNRKRYDSFEIGRVLAQPGHTNSRNAWIRVPRLGLVRFRLHRPMQGVVRETTITKDARGRWFVCFACDVGEAPPKRVVKTVTGIDLGLTTFAVLADGTEVENPRHMKHAAESLARAQRVLARKTQGSRSREKARCAVARVHARVRNARRDFHIKTARALVQRYDLIAHEDLNIAGLARMRLAKSVHDVAWGTFLRILHSKAEEAGVHVIAVDPRNTTRECSNCGAIVPKSLSERTHRCDCGLVMGRDHNAAINVLARGLRAVPGLAKAQATGPELQS
jgi:putative transposase